MKNIFLFVLLVFSSNMIAQQVYGVQRGQRGYIPPPKYEASVYVTTINAYEELEKVLPKSVETFNLDDFEREIFKGLLLEKYDNYNRIVENTDSSKQARQEALKQLEIDFVKGLAVILTPDEISMFVDMDFSGKEEKRKKRKKRKKKKMMNKNTVLGWATFIMIFFGVVLIALGVFKYNEIAGWGFVSVGLGFFAIAGYLML